MDPFIPGRLHDVDSAVITNHIEVQYFFSVLSNPAAAICAFHSAWHTRMSVVAINLNAEHWALNL